MTIEDMIDRKEITDACQGSAYTRKTIRNWIKIFAQTEIQEDARKSHPDFPLNIQITPV